MFEMFDFETFVTIVGRSAMMLTLLALICCGIAFACIGFVHVIDFILNGDEAEEEEKTEGGEDAQ